MLFLENLAIYQELEISMNMAFGLSYSILKLQLSFKIPKSAKERNLPQNKKKMTKLQLLEDWFPKLSQKTRI